MHWKTNTYIPLLNSFNLFCLEQYFFNMCYITVFIYSLPGLGFLPADCNAASIFTLNILLCGIWAKSCIIQTLEVNCWQLSADLCFQAEQPVQKISKLDINFPLCRRVVRIIGATIKFIFFLKDIEGSNLKLDNKQALRAF